MKTAPASRSPLKAPPLRYPGQSLDAEIRRLSDEKLIDAVLPALIFTIIAALEWLNWWQQTRPHPLYYTVAAVIALGYATYRFIMLRRQVRRLRLARDGERVVGQFLERLRTQGYHVFHDLIGDRFNIDHVLIGPGGIFTVETKTHSKPGKGPAEILYDGEGITLSGYKPQRDPIIQAKAQAQWLQSVLLDSTGKHFDVSAVVLYPGWFVKTMTKPPRGAVWVLNPKAFVSFLEHQPLRLSDPDLHLAASHLSRLIRTMLL